MILFPSLRLPASFLPRPIATSGRPRPPPQMRRTPQSTDRLMRTVTRPLQRQHFASLITLVVHQLAGKRKKRRPPPQLIDEGSAILKGQARVTYFLSLFPRRFLRLLFLLLFYYVFSSFLQFLSFSLYGTKISTSAAALLARRNRLAAPRE
jgi:hypothetical protein